MLFLSTTQPGCFSYHGQDYQLEPLMPPEIDLRQILVVDKHLGRIIAAENPALKLLNLDTTRLPGFPQPLPAEGLPRNARLLLLRGGGLGDLVTLTPALKQLRKRYGLNLQVTLSTFRDIFPLFDDHALVDRQLPHPVSLAEITGASDYYVDFSDPAKLFDTSEMIDFHIESLGIDASAVPKAEKLPQLPAALSCCNRIREQLACLKRPLVLFAGEASDVIRRLPPSVLASLAEGRPEISFIVPGRAIDCALPNVHSLDTAGGLSDFVSAIAACDALVSADSAAYHLAAALDKPALVLFGPINARFRTSYYPKCLALQADYQGQTCQAPCGLSAVRGGRSSTALAAEGLHELKDGVTLTTFEGRKFVFDSRRGCPEACAAQSRHSPCLLAIEPADILAGFNAMLALI